MFLRSNQKTSKAPYWFWMIEYPSKKFEGLRINERASEVLMRIMVYTGKPDRLGRIVFTPGKEYGIEELGYGASYMPYEGFLGRVGSVLGVMKRLDDVYNVQVHDDYKSTVISYETYDVFRSIWKFRDEVKRKER